MRILLAADFYPPVSGGLEGHVQRLARNLQARGHAVTVVTQGVEVAPGAEEFEVVTTRSSLSRIGGHMDASRPYPPPWGDHQLIETLTNVGRRVDAEVVHAHGWIAASAERAVRKLNVPLVVTLHDFGLLCPLRSLLRDGRPCSHVASWRCVKCPGANQGTLKRLALAGSVAQRRKYAGTTFIAVSRAVADRHLNASSISKVEVVPNFVDVPTRMVAPPRKGAGLLFVGPDQPYKGVALVDAAFGVLRSRGSTVQLVHVGGDRVGSVDHGIVRRGRLAGTDMESAFDDAAVVVIAPIWEDPCPTVALEAMAAGRPIVGTAIGGLLDLVEHNVTGLLVPPQDAVRLAEGIQRLMDDASTRATFGEAARRRLASFTSPQVVPRIERIYAEAIAVG